MHFSRQGRLVAFGTQVVCVGLCIGALSRKYDTPAGGLRF